MPYNLLSGMYNKQGRWKLVYRSKGKGRGKKLKWVRR